MKFETKIGLGEIVIINGMEVDNCQRANETGSTDFIGKVKSIHIKKDCVSYEVKYSDRANRIIREFFEESELDPDPEFNHETGCYPSD